jgi:hypothetical protein
MSFDTKASGYHEYEMTHQNPALMGVSLSQETDEIETIELVMRLCGILYESACVKPPVQSHQPRRPQEVQ